MRAIVASTVLALLMARHAIEVKEKDWKVLSTL